MGAGLITPIQRDIMFLKTAELQPKDFPMKFSNLIITLVALMANPGFAQTSAIAPASPTTTMPSAAASAEAFTALCKDGSNFAGPSKKGACSGHKGVKTWINKNTPTSDTKAASTTASVVSPATGGGAGKVWVNSSSNVYHCPGTKYYGKTKAGAYMSEADAKVKGAHPDHGKACH